MSQSAFDILWVEKYRPRSLDDIVNQKEIVDRLKRFVEEKNMPHLLFAGPPGTGKTTAAHALAHDLYGDNYRQFMLELNASVHGETPILIRISGKIRLATIGSLVDAILDKYNTIEANGAEYAKAGGFEVLSYSPVEGVVWKRVSYVVRHEVPAYLRIELDGGGILKLTGNHSVFAYSKDGLRLTSASDLREGDLLVSFTGRLASYASSHYSNTSATLLGLASSVDSSDVFQMSLREREALVSAHVAAGGRELRGDPITAAWLARISGYRSYINRKTALIDGPQESGLEAIKIKSIEVVKERVKVYDLSVPGTESFFAGQIPLLLHNSDERGINVIREKVKEFARSRTPPGIPFKIVLLDEADNMTADAQQALRRLMELYTVSTRFILIANYPSKIIDPIQSRCAFFRFSPLKKEDVISRLKYIAEKEGVDYEEEALEAIYEISEGDMRRAINILQSSAYLGRVTVDTVYKVVGLAKPKEVREMINAALKGDFTLSREMLRKLMIEYGLSGTDIVKQVHREIFGNDIRLPEDVRVLIADYLGEIHFRLVEGSDDDIQLSAFLAWLSQIGKSLGK